MSITDKIGAAKVASAIFTNNGHNSYVLRNEPNEAGAVSWARINSEKYGLVHVTFTKKTESNHRFPLTPFTNDNQDWQVGTNHHLFVWPTSDGRFLFFLVESELVNPTLGMTKKEVYKEKCSSWMKTVEECQLILE